MKLNMKKCVLPRLVALAFTLVLLLTATVTPVAAQSSFTDWVYNAATETLTATFPDGDTETYYRVEDSTHLRRDPNYAYKYLRKVCIELIDYEIYAAEERGESLALQDREGNWLFFVTKERKEELDSIFEGKKGSVSLSFFLPQAKAYRHYEYSKNILKALDAQITSPDGETVIETLRDLRYAPRYELWVYDEDGMVAYNYGYVLDLAGEAYYLPMSELPASALDQDGSILPLESVTVTLYPFPSDKQEDPLLAVTRASAHYLWSVETEADAVSGFFFAEDDATVAVIYFTIAILGIAVPIAPLVLGLCLPHSAKQGYKKRWYLLAIFGGAWMLLGILVLVMMMVAL